MRIIAGKAGRRSIRVPRGETRPTTDLVRQAIFSMLGDRVIDARVLDLFAGSGALGLEALSRGAASCVFVDESRRAEQTIERNLADTQLSGGQVVRADVGGWLRRELGQFDLIFADPPYVHSLLDRDHLSELLEAGLLAPRLAPGGCLVLEQAAGTEGVAGAGLELLTRRDYGGSAVLLYAPAGEL